MASPLARHLSALYSLCNSTLSVDIVRQRCLECGWQIVDEDMQHEVLRVRLDDAVSVFVASLAAAQEYGRTVYLPLFFMEDRYDCITDLSGRTKPDLDRAYVLAKSLFEREIGVPSHVGTFGFANGTYQYAVWRGTHAVLALIQDDFDVLFGSEVSAWLIECPADSPLPALPPHS